MVELVQMESTHTAACVSMVILVLIVRQISTNVLLIYVKMVEDAWILLMTTIALVIQFILVVIVLVSFILLKVYSTTSEYIIIIIDCAIPNCQECRENNQSGVMGECTKCFGAFVLDKGICSKLLK